MKRGLLSNFSVSEKEKTSFGGNEVLGVEANRLWGKDFVAASDFILLQWPHQPSQLNFDTKSKGQRSNDLRTHYGIDMTYHFETGFENSTFIMGGVLFSNKDVTEIVTPGLRWQ